MKVRLLCILLIIVPLITINALATEWDQKLYNEMTSPLLKEFKVTVERQARKFPGLFYLSGNPGSKMVALTFDDGPDLVYTPVILDILNQYNIPATFFVLGESVKMYPQIVMRINEEGHLLGNHSWSHPDFRNLSLEEIEKTEILPTAKLLKEITGNNIIYIRPPYGAIKNEAVAYLGQQGWLIVNWSLDTFDWDTENISTENIINIVEEYIHAGAIILLHNAGGNRTNTIEALPMIIESAKEKGYEFVTIAEILGI